jgi:hypothetical protein
MKAKTKNSKAIAAERSSAKAEAIQWAITWFRAHADSMRDEHFAIRDLVEHFREEWMQFPKAAELQSRLHQQFQSYSGPVPIRSKRNLLEALASLKAMPQALPC